MNFRRQLVILSVVSSVFVFIYSTGYQLAGVSSLRVIKFELYQLASLIGIQASVPPNPYNTRAEQLDARAKELAEEFEILEEEKILLKEQNLLETNYPGKLFIFLLAVSGILLILLIVNFYLDFKHRKS